DRRARGNRAAVGGAGAEDPPCCARRDDVKAAPAQPNSGVRKADVGDYERSFDRTGAANASR
ncbi:MAG: hypothetical protein ACK2UN_04650, partial [Candidatus Promineifilaceae bacterium]